MLTCNLFFFLNNVQWFLNFGFAFSTIFAFSFLLYALEPKLGQQILLQVTKLKPLYTYISWNY